MNLFSKIQVDLQCMKGSLDFDLFDFYYVNCTWNVNYTDPFLIIFLMFPTIIQVYYIMFYLCNFT